MKTIGCIGVGNMGGALLTAICAGLPDETILISDKDTAKTADFSAHLNCRAEDNRYLAEQADYLYFGVKPQYMASMLAEIQDILVKRRENGNAPVCITMAGGLTIASVCAMIGAPMPMIRIMPNTPVSVGQGMIMYTHTDDVSDEALEDFHAMLSCAGKLDKIPENLMDVGTALSGCGPAFLCLILEAMADGGVACGMPRKQAMLYAAQTMLGTAALALDTGKHPGVMKDEVTSPGGSTIAGVRVMEENGVRGAMMDAVIASYEKNLTFKK